MPARPDPAAIAATTLDITDESTTNALYRAAIGPVRCDYYLPVFTRFDAADRAGPSWNWAACLGTLNWMVFRQLWGPALFYAAGVAGLALLTLGIGRLSGAPFGIVTLCLLVALATLSFLVPGFFGNALFFAHGRKRMASALAATDTVPDACVLLNRQSSTRQRIAWLALGNAALAGAAIAVYLAPPPALHLAGMARQAADTRSPGTGLAGEPTTQARHAASASAIARSQPASVPAIPAAPAVVSAASAASATPLPLAMPVASSMRTPAMAAVASAPAMADPPVPEPSGAAPYPERRFAMAPAGLAAANPAPSAAEPSGAAPYPERRFTTLAPSTGAIAGVAPRASAPKVPAAKPAPAPKLTPAPAPTLATAAAPAPRYFINVGLFAQAGNAQRAHAKLLAAGLAAFTQELDTPNGKRTRVRVGPFDDRAQADDAAVTIRALELEAMVFRQ